MKTPVFCHFSTRSSNLIKTTGRKRELGGGEESPVPAAPTIPEVNPVGRRKRRKKRENEVWSEDCLVRDQLRVRGGGRLSVNQCHQIHQGERGGGVTQMEGGIREVRLEVIRMTSLSWSLPPPPPPPLPPQSQEPLTLRSS